MVLVAGGHRLGHADDQTADECAAGIVADWRRPNVLRLAPVPLYNRYRDVYDAVAALKRTLDA